MNKQIIRKINYATFELEWKGIPNSKLRLNFIPIIQTYNLKPPYCLLHWQARPKGLRRWGCYCATNRQYYSFNNNALYLDSDLVIMNLGVDENVIKTVPTAVMLLDKVTVKEANENEVILDVTERI